MSLDTHSIAWIGLGANLGDASQALSDAVHRITTLPRTQLEAASPLYHSAPVDADGPDYTNAVIRIRTPLAPLALLHALQAIENAAGRLRPYLNAPRTLDLDLLRYEHAGQEVTMHTGELTLPHPRMHERAFVLRPLNTFDAALVSPQHLAQTQAQRLAPLPPDQQWAWATVSP